MKKKLLVGLFTIIICFALVGCGKEEVLNNEGGTTGENELQNNNSEENINLYSDDNKIVFNYMDVYYITYYHEGEQITGLEYVYKYDNSETAKIAKTMLDSTYAEDSNVKDLVVKGKYIIITFNEEAYKDETLEDVKTTYSYLEQIYNNNNN